MPGFKNLLDSALKKSLGKTMWNEAVLEFDWLNNRRYPNVETLGMEFLTFEYDGSWMLALK